MDDRKKQIEELDRQRQENQSSLDSVLERLGETLLGRLGEENETALSPGEAGEYRRLQTEIAGAEASIRAIEDQIRRMRELEEGIALKEQEDSARVKELAGLHGRLGKLLLDNEGAYGEFTAPFREQTEALVIKVRSLEDRLGELEHKEGNNVFSWIGKNAQGLVLRSFLTKAQENLEQIYRNAGERYSRQDDPAAGGEIGELNAAINDSKNQAQVLAQELAEMREERRKIGDSFGADGGPLKQIQNLRNSIGQVRDELKILYRRFGAEAAARGPQAEFLCRAEDQPALDEALRLRQAIQDNERAMEKLRASLAIDEEQIKIEKCRKLIEDKKNRIAEAEKDIADFEESIADSEKYIAELRKIV